MTDEVIPRDVAIRAFAEALVAAVGERASKTVEQAARDAWYPGHPLGTVENIAAVIAERREKQRLAYMEQRRHDGADTGSCR